MKYIFYCLVLLCSFALVGNFNKEPLNFSDTTSDHSTVDILTKNRLNTIFKKFKTDLFIRKSKLDEVLRTFRSNLNKTLDSIKSPAAASKPAITEASVDNKLNLCEIAKSSARAGGASPEDERNFGRSYLWIGNKVDEICKKESITYLFDYKKVCIEFLTRVLISIASHCEEQDSYDKSFEKFKTTMSKNFPIKNKINKKNINIALMDFRNNLDETLKDIQAPAAEDNKPDLCMIARSSSRLGGDARYYFDPRFLLGSLKLYIKSDTKYYVHNDMDALVSRIDEICESETTTSVFDNKKACKDFLTNLKTAVAGCPDTRILLDD